MKITLPSLIAVALVVLLVVPAAAVCSGIFHLSGADCCCTSASEKTKAESCCESEAAPQPMQDCDCSFSEGTLPLSAEPFIGSTTVKSASVKLLSAWPDADAPVDPAALAGNYLRWLWHTQLGVGRSLYKMHSTYLC